MVGMVVREMKEFSFYNLCSTRRCKFTRHMPVFVVTGPVYVPFQKYNKLSTVNVQTYDYGQLMSVGHYMSPTS